MSSSSSSQGSKANLRQRQRRTRCDCGDYVGKWTAWSEKNPGRRFIGCPNYQICNKIIETENRIWDQNDVHRNCGFFDWVDPALPNQWYIDLIHELHNNVGGMNQEEPMEEAIEEVGMQQGGEIDQYNGIASGRWLISFLAVLSVLLVMDHDTVVIDTSCAKAII
ncbi:hypothetical protein LXL04_014665 [Taraxacum kok-saghyz]